MYILLQYSVCVHLLQYSVCVHLLQYSPRVHLPSARTGEEAEEGKERTAGEGHCITCNIWF